VTLILAVVLATLITLGYARYRSGAVQHDWESALSPEAHRQLEALRARMMLQEIVPAGIDRRYVYTRDDARQCAGG